MRVAWRDEADVSYASVGDCIIAIQHPHPSNYSRTYRITISLPNDEWYRFEVKEAVINFNLTTLKQQSVAKARELGCRRQRRSYEYDETWLTDLREAVLEDFQRAAIRYERTQDTGRVQEPIKKFGTPVGHLVGFFQQHFLGRDATTDEIRRAVNIVLRRLELEGVIEYETLDRKRYWFLSDVF
jgi:hypothetical protein